MKNLSFALVVALCLCASFLTSSVARADGTQSNATISQMGCDATYCWVILSSGFTNNCSSGSAWIMWTNDTTMKNTWVHQLMEAHVAGLEVDFHWYDSSCVNGHPGISYYQIH